MIEVGDKVECLGTSTGNVTVGVVYEITGIDSDGDAYIMDDNNRIWYVFDSGIGLFDNYLLVDSEQPVVPELLANLGRRLHEVEAKLEMAKEHKYYDDMVEAYAEDAFEPEVPEGDNVNSPQHYTQGAIEVIDYINQVADGYGGKQAYYVGNVIKYVSRAPYKNGIEDIKKAKVYLDWLEVSLNDSE